MKQVLFADTDARVSAMALGCLPFGSKLDRARSFEILDYYAEVGGNFLDTANNYSFWDAGGKGGESETVIGEWLKERKARDRTFIATKLGAFPKVSRDEFYSYPGDPWADMTEGLSRKTVLSAVDASLKRLGVDQIDLLYAHVDDRRVDQEETLEAFAEVVRQGKAKYIGCSNFKVWRLARARTLSAERGWPEYKAVQMFNTYLQTEKFANTGMGDQMGAELFDYANSGNQVALLGYTPLLWGSYTQPHKASEIDKLKNFDRPQNAARRARLQSIAGRNGMTVNQVVYAWMMQNTPPVIPLVAVSKLEHLKEDLASVDFTLSAEDLETLNAPIN